MPSRSVKAIRSVVVVVPAVCAARPTELTRRTQGEFPKLTTPLPPLLLNVMLLNVSWLAEASEVQFGSDAVPYEN